jgi:hypothetical protein
VDPLVAAGWWQAELVGLAGGDDFLAGGGRPRRPTTWSEITTAAPDLTLLFHADGVTTLAGVGEASQGAASAGGASLALTAPDHALPAPLTPGPGAIDVLERLAALLHPPPL